MLITLLKSDKDIHVESDYNPKLVSLVKALRGSRWDKKSSHWILPLSQEVQLINLLKSNNFFHKFSNREIFNTPLPKTDISYATTSSYDQSQLALSGELLPYQVAAMDYSKQKRGRFIIGDEMGLGKTIQAIAALKQFNNDWPVLIVAPASLLYNWRSEILKWIPELNIEDIFIPKKGAQPPSRKITICSYAYTTSNQDNIMTFLGVKGIVIIDEAHFIKNKDAKRTISITAIAHHAKRCILLTGTPMPNRPIELYSLLHAIDPINWNDYWAFAKRYCKMKRTKYGIDVSGAANLDELHSRMRKGLLLRRLKKDVLKQLPAKRRSTIVFGDDNFKNAQIISKINAAIDKVGKDFSEVKRLLLDSDAQAMAFDAYREAIDLKIDPIIEWVEGKIDDGMSKLVIFAHHKSTIERMQDKLSHHSPLTIDGSTDVSIRQDIVDTFQNNDSHKIILLSINAASTGLTLTKASNMLIAELPWSPSTAMQAEDRIHRIGQESAVSIYYAIAAGSVDGKLWSALKSKSIVASAALDGGNSASMTEESTPSDLLSVLIHEQIKLTLP